MPGSELIRAAMAQADFGYRQASDDIDVQTVENASAETWARMDANSDIVTLLQDAQSQLWDAEDSLRHAL